MKKSKGYIVLAVAGSIYILYNFIITSFIIVEITDEKFGLDAIFLAEVVVFIPVGAFFIVIQKLFKKKRALFTSLSLKSVALHMLLLVSFILIHSAWQVYFNSLLIGANFSFNTIVRDIIAFLNMRALIYIIAIGLVVGIVKIKEKEKILLEQSNLKLQLQKASFKELELKLNPEVIYPNLEFIKLNAHDKPAETSDLVLNLSKQLRILIDNIDEERIPLKKDILFFEYYFQAVQLRLDRELSTRTYVSSDCLPIEIPSLVLMIPLLEELFFGAYAEFTDQVKKVIYKSAKEKSEFIQLTLEMYYVTNPEILLKKLKAAPKLSEINELIAAHKGSWLKAIVDNRCLSILLNVKVEDK